MDRSNGIQVHLKGQHPLVGRGGDERLAPTGILRREEEIVSRGAPIRRRISVPNVDPTDDRAPVWLQSEIDRIAADRTRRDDREVARQDPSVDTIRLRDEKTLRTPGPVTHWPIFLS